MRKLVIGLVAVLALFVVADLVARNVAEARLADHIDEHEGAQGTSVDIHGLSFLLQAARGTFDEVDVRFPAMQTNRGVGVNVQVDDVTLTLSDVKTSDTFTRAVAKRVEGTGTVRYDEVTDRLGIADVSYDEESDGIIVSLHKTSFQAHLKPTVSEDGSLVLFDEADGLPAIVRGVLGQVINLNGVPDEVEMTTVEATEQGLQVTLEARNVPFAR